MEDSSRHADYDERHIDANHPYDGSGLAPRTCTDTLCLALFVGFLAGLCSISVFAFRSGDPRRLTHGFDYNGKLCGIDEEVVDMPLLYWCGAGTMQGDGLPSALDVKFPTCVSACPMDKKTSMACLGDEQVQVENTSNDPFTTSRTEITQSTIKQMSYPTMELGGLYCVPRLEHDISTPGDDRLTRSLLGLDGPLGNGYVRVITAVGGLRRCWGVVAGALLVAVLQGYAYLFLLKSYAGMVFQATLFGLTIALLGCGGYCLLGSVLGGGALEQWETSNLLYHHFDLDTAATLSRLIGMALVLLGIIALCASLFMQQAIKTALRCVEAACECVFSMPSMTVQPLIETAWKLSLGLFLMSVLMCLLSTAEMRSDFIQVKGIKVGGLTRTFVFSEAGKAMVAYQLFASLWLMEMTYAMSQFVISYSVVLWYYTPKPKGFGPHIPIVRGLIVGAVFHLGTLAMGSFLLTLTRPLRMVLGFIVRQSQVEGNPMGELIAECMSACISCYRRYFEFINKNAYIDVCISSTSFCVAARNSSGFIATEGGKVLALTGACGVFAITGVLGIALITGGLTFFMICTNARWYSETSLHHVADPIFVAAVAAMLGGAVASSFMVIVDHTADTLLYTYVWNKSHGHNTVQKYAPETLANLTDYRPLSKPQRSQSNSSGQSGGNRWFSTLFTKDEKPDRSEETQSLMAQRTR